MVCRVSPCSLHALTNTLLAFTQTQVEACNASVRPLLKEAGLQDTPDACWQLFLSKCRGNLHIVLAMSPSGDKLRLRCRNFPGLVSASVIDWFQPWPADALKKVSLCILLCIQMFEH
jgi:dynein heavy chain, axonemal